MLVGQEWHAGERLLSDALPVALTGADGTTLEVDPRSELQLVRADVERWFRLARGAVSAHVTKLKSGERFVVATPDAEVEVRGTRFQVTVVPPDEACGQGVVTRVAVSEGVVVVRSLGHEVRVEAGHHWPLGCPERTPPVAPAPERATVSVKRAPARARQRRRRARPAESVSASTLATENDLFSSALKAGRAGDRREAVELLDVLLARFPNSPLKQSAESARAKLSESIPASAMTFGETVSPGARPRPTSARDGFVVAAIAALGLLGCRVTLRFDEPEAGADAPPADRRARPISNARARSPAAIDRRAAAWVA